MARTSKWITASVFVLLLTASRFPSAAVRSQLIALFDLENGGGTPADLTKAAALIEKGANLFETLTVVSRGSIIGFIIVLLF